MELAKSNSDEKERLSRIAYKMWQEVCWELYGYECLICGESAGSMHHIIPRSKSKNLMYDLLNGVPLCDKHHGNFHHFVGKLTNKQMIDIIFKKRGEWQREYLEKNAIVPGVYTVEWLKEQIKYLQSVKELLNIN